jgi:hypothetical protein
MWQKHAAFASEAGQGRHSIIRKEWARRGVRSGQSGQFTPLRGVSGGCRAPPRAQADPGTPPFSPVSSRSWAIVSQTPPVPPSINFRTAGQFIVPSSSCPKQSDQNHFTTTQQHSITSHISKLPSNHLFTRVAEASASRADSTHPTKVHQSHHLHRILRNEHDQQPTNDFVSTDNIRFALEGIASCLYQSAVAISSDNAWR